MPVIKLIQISDCHLPENRQTLYRGEQAWERLEAIVAKVQAWHADAVVVSGDISEQAGSASYAFFQQTLAKLGIPIYCLNGNHDRREQMLEQFIPPLSLPESVTLGHWRLHFLDSASHLRIHGELTAEQLHRLAAAIDHQTEDWAIVFLHHQPFLCGSEWIDRYPLKQPDALIRLVEQREKVRSVCWGHIHHAWQLQQGHCLWQGCPSSTYTVLANQQSVVQDPSGPACRWLQLQADGRLETGILRLD